MRDALDVVDTWLTEAGIQRESLLITHIWLRDMSLFADMTSVWNDWVLPNALALPAAVCREFPLIRMYWLNWSSRRCNLREACPCRPLNATVWSKAQGGLTCVSR